MALRKKRIKTCPDERFDNLEIGGWLDGKQTYVSFREKNGNFLGTLAHQKLYRLAKAIVRHMEADNG